MDGSTRTRSSPLDDWLATSARLGYPKSGGAPVRLISLLAEHHNFGREALLEMLDALADVVDDHLDAFCTIGTRAPDESTLPDLQLLCHEQRAVLEAAIIVACAQLSRARLSTRATCPGRMLVELTTEVMTGSRNRPLSKMLTQARNGAPAQWAALAAIIGDIESETSGWLSWPSRDSCERALRRLEAVRESWLAAVENVLRDYSGGTNRNRRRDPAFRRAQRWWVLVRQLFERTNVQRGDVRITMEYWLAVLDHFEMSQLSTDTSLAARELVVLEILALLGQPRAGNFVPHPAPLELGSPTRRKRIQRVRLQVISKWSCSVSDERWTAQVLPGLRRIGSQLPS